MFAAGILISIVAWGITETQVERAAYSKFDALVADSRNTLQTQLRSFYGLMHGLEGLFLVTPHVTRDTFTRYVTTLGLGQRLEAVRSISYSRLVPHARKQQFVDEVRHDRSTRPQGFPRFEIKPAGDRLEYLVVTYVEPLEANEAGLGLDLAAAPQRRLAVDRARDSGSIIASGRFTLVSVPIEGEWAVSLRLAAYRSGLPLQTVEERRAAFTGAISLTFMVRDVVSDVVWQDPAQPLHVRITDAGDIKAPGAALDAAAETVLFDSAGRSPPPDAFKTSVPLEIGGRQWNLHFFAPREYFLSGTDKVLPWIVLLGGIVISLLLGGLVRALATSGQYAAARRLAQELIEALPNPIFFKGTDGRYLGMNKAWERFFGRRREEFIGATVHDLYRHDTDTAARIHESDQAMWSRPGTQTYEMPVTTAAGLRYDTIFYRAPFSNPGGEVAGLIGTIMDITERKNAEQRRAMEHAVTRVLAEAESLAEAIPTIIRNICETLNWHCGARWAVDKATGLLRCHECWGVDSPEIREFVEENAKRTVQLEPDGDTGLVRQVYSGRKAVWIADLAQAKGFKRAALVGAARLRGAFCFPLLVGNDVLGVMEFFHRDVRPPDNTLIRATQAIGSQIGQFLVRKQAEETLQFVATHDALTGLPNRVMFNDRLQNAVLRAKRNGCRVAVLFIDLDRFKVINDSLGHDAGDIMLREVAARLTYNLRASDTVARLGGDEFVVLIGEVSDPVIIGALAQKLLAALGEPFVLSGREYHVTVSIGISTYPDDTEDLQTLLKNADIAMYRTKEQGRNGFQFYSAHMNVHSEERLMLESDLRRALERNELVLHYQPRIDFASGAVTGVEALVRWQHPVRGLIPPAKFIPLAEETGLIDPIGNWVLEAACAQRMAWTQAGLPAAPVAVNLSPRQFAHGDLVQNIAKILGATGCDPAWLELEITEGMVMRDPENTVAVIQRLKDMGIRVAIDDFGTGYSSLAYLKRFPLDSLKIDRSFVMDIPGDAGDVAITTAIIAMAHSLGLKVIAEGVETAEQFEFLRAQGCDEMQGFYFSKPLPESQASALFRQPREAPRSVA